MISVIVPVYNAEAYLEDCVRSIMNQTYRDLEILLVDDGSRDGSPELCRRLAAEDPRITVLTGPNGGAASARNRGLEAARGEYIAFADSDDTLLPSMYGELLQALEEHQADIAECGFWNVEESDGSRSSSGFRDRVSGSAEECLENCAHFRDTAFCPWNKLYRRETIGEERFPAYAVAEDALFNVRVLTRCRKKVTLAKELYNYRLRSESLSHHVKRGRELDEPRAWQEILCYLADVQPEPGARLWRQLSDIALGRLADCYVNRPDNMREAVRELKSQYIHFYPLTFPEGAGPGTRQRLGFLLFQLSPRAYVRHAVGGK